MNEIFAVLVMPTCILSGGVLAVGASWCQPAYISNGVTAANLPLPAGRSRWNRVLGNSKIVSTNQVTRAVQAVARGLVAGPLPSPTYHK